VPSAVQAIKELSDVSGVTGKAVKALCAQISDYLDKTLVACDKTAAAEGWAAQIAGMDELRAAVDILESLVPAELWPMPRYEEMLFL